MHIFPFRYDFVLEANQEVGNFWFRVHGQNKTIFNPGLAVINYRGAPQDDPDTSRGRPSEEGVIYQPTNGYGSDTAIDVDDLVARGQYEEFRCKTATPFLKGKSNKDNMPWYDTT